jgi:hypothetical protein
MIHTRALLLLCLLSLLAIPPTLAAPPVVETATLSAADSLAMPGGVVAPITVSPAGWEILNWTTALTPEKTPGAFTLRLAAPTSGVTLLAYEPGEVSYQTGGQWKTLPAGGEADRRLRALPLPAGVPVTAVRFTVPARLPRGGVAGKAAYQATLPFATLLTFRACNIAPQATVVVSSSDKPSTGFQPQPWLNRPETLVDGFVDERRNFFTAPREAEITPDKPEWILLRWEEPQRLRALGLLRGRDEKGLGTATVEVYTGAGDPRFTTGTEDWTTLPTTWTAEGKFRALRYGDFGQAVTARGLRLRTTGGLRQLSVGEIAVFSDLGTEAAPTAAAREGRVPIPFTIPGPGKVTIQVRDATGQVVANPVAGVEFPAGKNIAYWNLEDVVGKPVLQPGAYTWRGLYVPGLTVDYKHTYFPTPLTQVAWQTPDQAGGWLADHEPPRTICRAGETMWLGAFAEAGDSIVQTDADAQKLWGINRIWVAIPHEICSDGDFYFGFCEGGWIGDNQAIIQIDNKTHASRKIFQRETPKKNAPATDPTAKTGVTGFQVVGDRAFVSFGAANVVQVFDIGKGLAGPWRGFAWDVAYKQFDEQKPVLLKEIALPSPGRLRKFGADSLVTTSGQDIVTIDLATYAVRTLVAGKLRHPLGLGVDAQGNVYVGEGAPLHQVIGYAPTGAVIATLGKPGRREIGPFDPQNLEEPYGVEVGPDGRVWVMEHTDYPKRVSLWDPKSGKCVKAIYGPTQYGGGGSIDPADENRLFYKGMEFRRDPKTGAVTPVNLLYRPDSARFARFSENDYPCYAFRSEGKLWFTSFMWPHGHPTLVLWQHKGDHVMPVAAMGSAFALRRAFGEPEGGKGDRSTDFLTKYVPGYAPEQKYFTWTDLNDDGHLQPAELKFGKLEFNGRQLAGASAGWNWRMNAQFTAVANAGDGRILFFPPTGRSPHGYPRYDVPTTTVPGSGEALMPDGQGNAIVLGGPMTSVAPDGTIRWRYRNDWPGLHAGHLTTARGDEPGVLIAPTRIWGIVPVNTTLGEVVAFNSNLGCTYLMTADDGLYIDRVFRDQRVGLLWNYPTPPTPEVLAETSLYDEHFGGTFQKVRGSDGKDHFYYVCGKNHCSVVELTGLEAIQRLPGAPLTVTPAQIAAAQEGRQLASLRTAEPKVYTVPKVADGAITIDGTPAEWPAARIDGFALAYDATRLYVLFSGRDDRATFMNKGTNPLEFFKTGDVVDVMLQTRAGLNPNRTEAGLGDLRLSFSIFEGKPVCVAYDFRVPDFRGQRIPFSSPWRTVWCDRAGLLPDAEIVVKRGNGDYTLEASIPLAAIHLDPAALGETRGDVGRVLSDQTGTQATSRVYWANKNTNIMADLPSEAGLQPNLWGLFRFGK